MSAKVLQRVLVRMLYDPDFVERVYANPETSLRELELSPREREWLQRPDRRAYGVDAYRRSRTLQALVGEYPAACALALAHDLRWAELDAFFSSSLFHVGIQRGRSLALVFGGHLFELAGIHADREPRLEPLARLERGLARVRRRISHARGRDGDWCLSPEVETLELPRGTLGTHQLVMGRLGKPEDIDPTSLVDSETLRGLSLSPLNGGREHLLLALGEEDGVRIEPLSPELFAILETTRGGVAHEELVGVCRALGAEDIQIDGILEDFVTSGELVPPSDRKS